MTALRTGSLCLFLACLGRGASGSVTFFTDQTDWLAQVQYVQTFQTHASNIALSDEILSPPGQNDDLGSLLTFPASSTGLSRSFQLRSVNVLPPLPAGLVFNDANEAGIGGPRNISIGDANGVGNNDPNRPLYENDDFIVDMLSGPALTAFAFYLIGNQSQAGERLIAEFAGVELGALVNIPVGGSSNVKFLGLISDSPVDRVHFDEGASGDDIAIRDFFFAQTRNARTELAVPVPEPSSLILCMLGLASAAIIATRTGRVATRVPKFQRSQVCWCAPFCTLST